MDVKHHVYKMMRYLQAAKAHKFYNYVHMTAIVCTWRKIWNNVDCWHFRSQTRPKHPNSKKMIHRTAFLVKSHLADSIAESVTYSDSLLYGPTEVRRFPQLLRTLTGWLLGTGVIVALPAISLAKKRALFCVTVWTTTKNFTLLTIATVYNDPEAPSIDRKMPFLGL